MKLTDEERNLLVCILKDHRDCLTREGYPQTSGKEVLEELRRHGIVVTKYSAEEIDSKANLVWQIDELVERLERGK